MPRECSCRGGNENCKFCNGSGYVDRPELPVVSHERKSWGPAVIGANSESFWIEETENDPDVSHLAFQLSYANSLEEIDVLWAGAQANAEAQASARRPEWRGDLAEWKTKTKLEALEREVFFAKARLRTRLEAEARAKVWDEIRADTQARAERDLIEAQARADARAKARAEEEARIKAAAEARAKARVSAEQAWRAKVSSEQAERAKMLAKMRAEAAVLRIILIAILIGFVLIGILSKILK